MPKRQIPFLSSVLRGDIQNYCKFELQSPDDMTIVNKLLYIDSYYLTSMVIFSNVLKRWFWNNFLAKSCFKTTFHHGSLTLNHCIRLPHILLPKITAAQNEAALSYHRVRGIHFLAVIFPMTIIFQHSIFHCLFILLSKIHSANIGAG